MQQRDDLVDRGGPRLRVEDPRVSDDAIPIPALCDIAAGLARVERGVTATPGADPLLARSSRLIATSGYDVWLITWPAGSEIGWHDHGAATSVIRVVAGSLTEWSGTVPRPVLPGYSLVMEPFARHRLRNTTRADTTTLHVYSPPLSAVTYHDGSSAYLLHPAGANSDRIAPIRSHRAEASSAPLDVRSTRSGG